MRRFLVALAALGIVLATHPAGAATTGALHLTDLKGDANGINGQDFGLPLPETSTDPASLPGADIVGIDVTTIYKTVAKKKVAKGTSVVMRLAGPVVPGINYLLTAKVSTTCDGGGGGKTIQLGYSDRVKTKFPLAVCQAPTTTGKSTPIGTASASGNSITWILDPIIKAGETMSTFYASSNVFVLGVFDESTATGTYTYAK